MPGLGTIINILFIIIGGIAGLLFGNRLKERSRETLLLANAVAVLFIGIGGALQHMLVVDGNGKLEMAGTMMLIASLSIGAVVGEPHQIDIQRGILVVFIQQKHVNLSI